MTDLNKLKTDNGLKSTDEVEAYFGRMVVATIESLGKRPTAWDEQVPPLAGVDFSETVVEAIERKVDIASQYAQTLDNRHLAIL